MTEPSGDAMHSGNNNKLGRALILLTAIVITLGGGLFFLLQMAPEDDPVSVLGNEPDNITFSLVTHNEELVTEKDFYGKTLLLYFGFTSCPDVCPRTLSVLSKATQQLKQSGYKDELTILFITVDPQRDTPQTMERYLARFPGNIIGLTGTSEQTEAIARTVRAHYKYGQPDSEGNYPVTHSDFVYLISESGKYITHIKPDKQATALAAHIRQTLSTPSG